LVNSIERLTAVANDQSRGSMLYTLANTELMQDLQVISDNSYISTTIGQRMTCLQRNNNTASL